MLNTSNLIQSIKSFLKEEKSYLLNKTKNTFNNFSIAIVDDGYKVSCFNKHYVVDFINKNIDYFSQLPIHKDLMKLLVEPQIFSSPNRVINICYFDLLIFQMLNTEEQTIWFKKLPIIKKITDKKFNRAKIFEVNKSAITFDRTTRNKKYQEIISKGFNFVEFPKDFKVDNLIELTNNIDSLVKEKQIPNFTISLRVKKLGLYNSKGFYSKETNTIFLDPRHLDVWRHELGHYFYKKENIKMINEEEFADNF
jgi:hypothetical protein